MLSNSGPSGSRRGKGLTRRQVITAGAIAALAVNASAALAGSPRKGRRQGKNPDVRAPLRRYMAVAVALQDGRVLICGGYDRPWAGGTAPTPLSSAVIYDPSTDSYTQAPPMNAPRARHAGVLLSDGRIAVLGGVGQSPTSSVEVYDPALNTWEAGPPLQQPRYDHVAASTGGVVYVMGGSAVAMHTSMEVYDVNRQRAGL